MLALPRFAQTLNLLTQIHDTKQIVDVPGLGLHLMSVGLGLLIYKGFSSRFAVDS